MRTMNVACALALIDALGAVPAHAEAPCCPHPYDYSIHAAAGIGLGYQGAQWHPALGVLLSAAAGVGKEMLDKKYDPKDAFATMAGGLVGVGLYLTLGRDNNNSIIWIGDNMIGFRIRFH